MEVSEQVRLKFHGVDFPSVNFSASKPRDDASSPINISITPKVFYPKDIPNQFKIIQDVKLTCEGYFDFDAIAIGNFEIDLSTDETQRTNFINSNAPAIMFPYVRAFISNFTSSIGYLTGTIIIPPHFFKGQLEIHEDESI